MVTCVLGTKIMDMKRCIFGSVGDQTVIMGCIGMRNISIKCRKCVYKSKFGCLEPQQKSLSRTSTETSVFTFQVPGRDLMPLYMDEANNVGMTNLVVLGVEETFWTSGTI